MSKNEIPDSSRLSSVKTAIRTQNFDKSKHFYTNLLGLEVSENYDDGDGSRGCIVRIGNESSNAFIEISEIKPNHSYYQNAFGDKVQSDKIDLQIRTTDVNFWATRLQGKCELRGPVKRPWGSQYLHLRE